VHPSTEWHTIPYATSWHNLGEVVVVGSSAASVVWGPGAPGTTTQNTTGVIVAVAQLNKQLNSAKKNSLE
jgi:hypothetical protein